MKKMMMLMMGSMLTMVAFGQDRQTYATSRAYRVDRVQQVRLQQARIRQIRLDQPDINQQRIAQARIKQARIENARTKEARIENARMKDVRIEHARVKQQRIKHARIKKAREDAASGDNQIKRRRYHKAKKEAKRKRWVNQQNDGNDLDN